MAETKSPRRGRWLLWTFSGVAAVVVLAVIGGVLVLNGALDRVDVDGLGQNPTAASGSSDEDVDDREDRTTEIEPDPDALTVLVLGSDSRDVLTEEERVELGTGYAWGERTSSIMLARLEPGAENLRVLNVPRDALVTRCDGSRGRVNAAYGIGERNDVGGMTCTVETLRDWLGITIDHAVKVDFRGFVDIVDALDGVPMYLEEALYDENANLDLEAGCTRLDGAQALAFARARSIDDDFGRMGRQQRLVEEMRRELASGGLFDDIPRLLRTTDAIASSLQLDSSLTLNRLQQLARQHHETVRAPVDGRAIPGVIRPQDGFAFLEIEDADAAAYASWLVDGVDPDESASGADADPGTGETTGDPGIEGDADGPASANDGVTQAEDPEGQAFDQSAQGQAEGQTSGEAPSSAGETEQQSSADQPSYAGSEQRQHSGRGNSAEVPDEQPTC